MTYSRRLPRLLAAVCATVALAACGTSTEPDRSSPADTIASPPSLVTPRPVNPQPAGGRSAEMSADGDAAMIAPWAARDITFVAGDNLELPDNTTGWYYAPRTATSEEAARLAAGFGVVGEPVEVNEWEPGGWRVGPDDGGAPAVWISNDAQGSWSYSGVWGDGPNCAVAVNTVEAVSPDTPVADEASVAGIDGDVAVPGTVEGRDEIVEECEVVVPEGVPTAAEAVELATATLRELGVDPDTLEISDSYADEWFASVDFRDQHQHGRWWSFGYSGGAELSWASGTLAEPQEAGPYPLIGVDEAIERLNEQNNWWGDARTLDIAAVSEPVEGDTLEGGGVDAAPPAAGDTAATAAPAAPAGMPVDDTEFEVEEVTLTVTAATADVWWAWDAEGAVWLVPAWSFTDNEGGTWMIAAVTDDYLIDEPTYDAGDDTVTVGDQGRTEPGSASTGSVSVGSAGTPTPEG